jgi:hypothetical protein
MQSEQLQPNFYSLISDKTKDFVGRKWVFDQIDNWLNDDSQNKPKYFIITGKAGSGKSTIAAKLIEISNSDLKGYDGENNHYTSHIIKKGFLDASYVVSFRDNLSTDPKTLVKSLSNQLASNNNKFAKELMYSTKTSNIYNIEINASQQQIDALRVSGGNYNININGSPSAMSVFNDLVRSPLESFLTNDPQKKVIFLVDGLDESITSSKESYSDSIISILSNLDALKNVYFIITTRDYENILNKFWNKSLVLDLSSQKYIEDINDDVSSFIKLNFEKNTGLMRYSEDSANEIISHHLIEKVQGNFLYIKFVMDAVNENKIGFTLEEIDNMPPGLWNV